MTNLGSIDRERYYELSRQALACGTCGGTGTVWPKGGYAQSCEDCRSVSDEAREVAGGWLPTMSIKTPPGSLVRYCNGRNGGDYDVRLAAKHLTLGNVYTVERVEIHDYSSALVLREFPKLAFNTVQFENVEAAS